MNEVPAGDVVPLAEVSARTGLSAYTLFYYEQEGLLPRVARSSGGQRRYRQVDLDRLAFLRERGVHPMPEPESTGLTDSAFELLPLHHVQLAIPPGGEDECRAFWGGLLGMRELQKPPVLAARGGCWFRGGGLEVHLGVEDPFLPAKKAHPGLLVAGLAEVAEALERGGHTVTWDDDFPGHHRFYAADPFGNRLEFLEPADRPA